MTVYVGLRAGLTVSASAIPIAVLSISLGWSIGSLVQGRFVHRWGSRNSALAGSVFLIAGCALTLFFSTATRLSTCFLVFGIVGVGMGFVALATILVVQNSVDPSNLGVATASHQFSPNLGGTVGVGMCGSLFTAAFSAALESALAGGLREVLPAAVAEHIQRNAQDLFQPAIQAQLNGAILHQFQEAVAQGTLLVFWAVLAAALACLVGCKLMCRHTGA